jgi:hypothetical protein
MHFIHEQQSKNKEVDSNVVGYIEITRGIATAYFSLHSNPYATHGHP